MYIQSNISGSLKARRQKKGLLRFCFGLFLLLVIFVCFCFISNSETLKIKEIKILNSSSIPEEEIRSVADYILSQKYLFFISKENFLLIPKGEIEKTLLSRFIKLDQAKVFLLDKNKLAIEVKEREVKAKWCDDALGGSAECFFLDKDGLLFASVPELFGNSFVSFSGKLRGTNFIGSYYDTSIPFSDILVFCDNLKTMNFPVVGFLSTGDHFEVYLKGGAAIYLDDTQGLDRTLENIQSMVSDGVIKTDLDFINRLNHLDLRYGNKIHFDFKP